MTIRIELQSQVYQETLDDMLFGSFDPVLGSFKGVPSGAFTNLEGRVTQYTVFGTSFKITTDNVGEKHTIRTTLISLDNNLTVANRDLITEKVVVPVNETFVVFMPLRKGENQIDVFTDNDGTFTSVISSHVGTFVTSYAREIFSSTQNPLNEQTRAIFSKFSSRMTEILIPFQDLYADPKSLRTLISRFITRAYMTKNGSTQGIRDFGAALLGTTPIFVPTKTDEGTFEPNVVPLFRRQLEFAGFEAHTWIPNFEIIHWLSFIKLIDAARNYYKIQEIGESEVLITAGGVPEIHRFNFDDPEATAYSEFNFTDFRVVVEILNKLNIIFCAAGYPFDLFVTADNPLGQKRLTFDSSIPFDSGELLDQSDLDPGADGFVGFPLSGRFERYVLNDTPIELSLDSLFINPAIGSSIDQCAYEGFFTQQLELFSQSVNIPTNFLASGEVNESSPSSEENLSISEFRVDTDILDFSTLSDFSITSGVGSIISNDTIALGGTASVQYLKNAAGSGAVITWTNPGAPLDLTSIGADTVYLTIYLGEDTLAPIDAGVPSFPGKLDLLSVGFVDGSGNSATYTYNKEDLQFGVNVLPLLLDFPDGGASGSLDRSDIRSITFNPAAVTSTDIWENLFLGRMHVLANEAHFRPARAKIELEDINNVFAQSLYGGKLNFTDPDGVETVFTGDETYNDLDENAYIPNLYKIQLTEGVGTEGFDRAVTAENLRTELGRQGDFLKTSVVDNLPGEIYLDVFSKQLSSSGSRNTLAFTPDPTNPVVPDLIATTSFAGGFEGQNTRLGGGSGNLSIAQRFEVTDPSLFLDQQDFSIALNGTDEFMLSASALVDIADEWSMSGWFRRTDTGTSPQALVNVRSVAEINSIFWSRPSGTSDSWRIVIVDSAGTTIKNAAAEGILIQDQWVYLVLTFNGNIAGDRFKMYANGVDVTPSSPTTDITGTMTDTSRKISLGASINGSNLFQGNIFSLAIWDSELSAAEALATYNNGNGGTFDLNTNLGNYTSSTNLKHWFRAGLAASPAIGDDYADIIITAHDLDDESFGVTNADRSAEIPLGPVADVRFAELFLHRIGTPEGTLTVSILEDNPLDPVSGTAPGLLQARATDKFVVKVTDGVPNYEIFGFEAALQPGLYWLVLSGDAVYEASNDAENHVIWGMASTGSLPSGVTDGVFASGTFWDIDSGINHFFKVIGDI